MNRFLSTIGILSLLCGSLVGTGCRSLSPHAKSAPCPDCDGPVCHGCKHCPDPGTSGYHCTIWVPMCDPCAHAPFFHPPGFPETEVVEEGAPSEAPQPMDYFNPESLPPSGSANP